MFWSRQLWSRQQWLRRAETLLRWVGILCIAFWSLHHVDRLLVRAAADRQLVAQPLVAQPPVAQPPVAQPPGTEPPVAEATASEEDGRILSGPVPSELASVEPDALAAIPIDRPAVGDLVARISIPRLELDAVALHGTDESTLRRAVGHFEHAPMPGEAGNVAFAGHRDAEFRALEGVAIGDEVLVETPRGRFAYRVTETQVVDPSRFEVAEDRGVDEVTLVTCFPFRHIGPAPQRFVVHAAAVP